MPEVGVKRGRRERKKEKVLSRGPTPFPSRTRLQASTSPCRSPFPKKKSINKRTVAQIGEGMSRFSMGFQEKAQGAEIFLLLSAVQMGLMSLELEALLVIEVLISCENWFPSFGGSCTDWGYIPAWESKIRAKWTETNLLYKKKKPKRREGSYRIARKKTKTKIC